jgi:alpha-glucosidase
MIKKHTFGKPFNTEATVMEIPSQTGDLPFGSASKKDGGLCWKYALAKDDKIFGLGETMRGINKRGYVFESVNTDQPNQDESTKSLYGSHNFFIVFGKKTFGVFIDYPGRVVFDLGFAKCDELCVQIERADVDIYFFTCSKKAGALKEIAREFRTLVGKSYIAPKWAFGFCQSRWGYASKDDIEKVWKTYRKLGFPLDSICMDIDYMEDYKDFTVDSKKFPNFKDFVQRLKKDGTRLVPIIDAGVKKEAGYSVYQEMIAGGYDCKKKDGATFEAGVWPGDSVFADFLNPKAREWFGKQYKALLDAGIEGFWNDMNEPALFYTKENLKKTFVQLEQFKSKALDVTGLFDFMRIANSVCNNKDDYKSFYHKVNKDDAGSFAATKPDKDGKVLVNHYDIHNLYGYNMTRGASQAFKALNPAGQTLLYSRSSYIGAHRYGGVWTGDNHAYWGDILLSLQQIVSLNLCGFLYTGSDIGGFNANTSRDLLLRWTAFALFTPLFRNHSARGTREQEYYQFENPKDFKSMVQLRYALIPYLYSEYLKAAKNDGLYARALAFDFSDDKRACAVNDQILIGNEIMVAPVYVQNAIGRYVYLPETMTMVEWKNGKIAAQKKLSKGDHFIEVPMESVVFFVRKGKKLPLAKAAPCVDKIDWTKLNFVGDPKASYELVDLSSF